ncbi:MAG TPA: pyridoxamine 5'-phosphate oxidase [Nocardioidaceae bacterium]|nr:pyridoxamine 5'-phosphate oxidase [Nocardioidaceae bacterium]
MMLPPQAELAAKRREYGDRGLTEADLGPDPLAAVQRWLADAEDAGLYEPNAMLLATAADTRPSARMVLLKTLDHRGFVFFTNYRSRKAVELAANPACALVLPWHPLERQVRAEGAAERVDPAESDAYFAARPRAAQLGAWASPQSEVVDSREALEGRYARETDRFASYDEVPRPPHWGGILVRPRRVEFWQGRAGRMHDRVAFDRIAEGAWAVTRLAP